MRLEFLTDNGADRLILIFAGWGSDARLFSDIEMPGWDVAVLSGFDDTVPNLSKLKSYPTVYLFAWSLGVWQAERLLPGFLTPVRAYALNGTPWPGHDTKGIPAAIFAGTAATLSERNLRKFRVRMCGGTAAYETAAQHFDHISDIETLRSELQFVEANPLPEAPRLHWDAAYIGADDRIFPPQNQRAAWSGHTEIIEMQMPHLPEFAAIVRRCVVNVERVGKRFTRSMSTYDAHAHAQRLIAERLCAKAFEGKTLSADKTLEIGPGTGLFTRQWSKLLSPAEALFIDLCPMPCYGVAPAERYFEEDAEAAVERLAQIETGSVDAVFSTSAIQWFSNLPHFFDNCRRLMRPDALLAMTTFAPGNLSELQSLRPDHLRYPEAEELRNILTPLFENVRVEQEDIEIEFSTPADALRHLQLTGVTTTGTKVPISQLRRFLATFPMNPRGRYTLTFRPIYLLCSNPKSEKEG